MVIDFVLIRHKRCRPKTNFYVLSYDKTSLKICVSFKIFPCSIHGDISKIPLSELCEKENSQSKIEKVPRGIRSEKSSKDKRKLKEIKLGQCQDSLLINRIYLYCPVVTEESTSPSVKLT